MPLPFHRRRLDPDAADFCRRSGATDRAAINAFVRGVKDLGLWDNMVCWPLRSSQNAGFGSTVYSLGGLGTFDGTLVGGPGWTVDGIVSTVNAQAATCASLSTVSPVSFIYVGKQSGTNSAVRMYSSQSSGNGRTFQAATGGLVINRGLNSATNLSFATNQFNFHGWTVTSATTGNLFSNATTAAVTPSANWNSAAEPSPFAIFTHVYFSGATDVLESSLAMAIQGTAISQAQFNSIRDLYKSTLGTGLGLP